MKKLFLLLPFVLISCFLDDLDLSVPEIWISQHGGKITVHNDASNSRDVSGWKLAFALP